MKHPPRFLLSLFRFHGDMLLLTPVVAEILRLYPNAAIDLFVYQGMGQIFAADPRISWVIEFPEVSKTGFWNGVRGCLQELKLILSLRHTYYDFSIHFTTQYRQALLARILKINKSVGIICSKRQKSFWLNSFDLF